MDDFSKLELALFGAKAKAIEHCQKITTSTENVDGSMMLALYQTLAEYKELFYEVKAIMEAER